MLQSELVAAVAKRAKLSQETVRSVLQNTGDVVLKAARKEDEIVLPVLGKLKAATREARTGRNPATGESIEIAETRTLSLKLSRSAKDYINQ